MCVKSETSALQDLARDGTHALEAVLGEGLYTAGLG